MAEEQDSVLRLSRATQARLQLSDAQIHALREAYGLMDKDSNGNLELEEIGDALRVLGGNPKDTDVEKLVRKVETVWVARSIEREERSITFEVFCEAMADFVPDDVQLTIGTLSAASASVEDRKRKLREAFRTLDMTGDGLIDIQEFQHFIKSMGEKIDKKQIVDWFKSIDTDGSGSLDMDEFVSAML